MKTLRIVTADDEDLARALLREYLAGVPGVEIVAECANGFEAVKAVEAHGPDVILLDIQMPRLDGFEVLDLIRRDTRVIFISAYDQYAIRAFEVHAVDYLLKPFSAERLAGAIGRVRNAASLHEGPSPAVLRAAARPGASLERVLIRDGGDVHVLPVSRIDYLEAQDDYVCYRAEGKRYLKQQTLAEAEIGLDPLRFVRIHRSYILNVERLSKIELYAKDSHAAILSDGTRLPVSRSGYARLQGVIG